MSEAAKRPGMLSAIRRITTDGWINVLTGLGVTLRDKRMSAAASHEPLSQMEVEELYAADDVAATVVDSLPEDAVREWLTVSSDEEGLTHKLDVALDRLALASRLEQAWKWARLYGGSALLLNVDDSKDLAQPLDPDAVRELKSLTVLSRHELQPGDIELDITSPMYGRPITRRLAPRRADTKALGQVIHYTRLLTFDGVDLPMQKYISNNYWGDSVLTRAVNAIRNYNVSNDAVATILQEFNQGVFKIKNLADMLLAGQDTAVQQRLEAINMARSICRSVVIDQDEEFTNVGAAVTGIPDVLDRVAQRLVTASHMPATKLLGKSPSGLGATGESEKIDWNNFVSNQQELMLRPKVQLVIDLVLRSRKGPTAGRPPKSWSFEFRPLVQLDEKQQAEARQVQAEVDKIYIETNVLDPEEVAVSRFGAGKFSFETTLDLAARKTPDQPKPVA